MQSQVFWCAPIFFPEEPEYILEPPEYIPEALEYILRDPEYIPEAPEDEGGDAKRSCLRDVFARPMEASLGAMKDAAGGVSTVVARQRN